MKIMWRSEFMLHELRESKIGHESGQPSLFLQLGFSGYCSGALSFVRVTEVAISAAEGCPPSQRQGPSRKPI